MFAGVLNFITFYSYKPFGQIAFLKYLLALSKFNSNLTCTLSKLSVKLYKDKELVKDTTLKAFDKQLPLLLDRSRDVWLLAVS